jgi:hypothetical protein
MADAPAPLCSPNATSTAEPAGSHTAHVTILRPASALTDSYWVSSDAGNSGTRSLGS